MSARGLIGVLAALDQAELECEHAFESATRIQSASRRAPVALRVTEGGVERRLELATPGTPYPQPGRACSGYLLTAGDTRVGAWLRGLLARVHLNTAVVALAAKMARTVWALLRHGSTYEAAVRAA